MTAMSQHPVIVTNTANTNSNQTAASLYTYVIWYGVVQTFKATQWLRLRVYVM